jgi:hypothetical protein
MTIPKRRLALIVSVILVLLCALLQHTYRPFIYANHLNDWHLADTLTSWFAVPAATLFFWGISGKRLLRDCLIGALAGLLLYEFLDWRSLDWFDVIALILSGGLTYWAYIIYGKIRSHRSHSA